MVQADLPPLFASLLFPVYKLNVRFVTDMCFKCFSETNFVAEESELHDCDNPGVIACEMGCASLRITGILYYLPH